LPRRLSKQGRKEERKSLRHSYTSTSDLHCKRKYYHKHVARDVEREDTPQMEYGRLVHDAMRGRIEDYDDLPDNLYQLEEFALALDKAMESGLVVEAERKLGMTRDYKPCDFHDPACWWCGILDVVIRDHQTALMYDWKTGKVREDPTELKMHAALLKAHHPELEVIKGRYIWLRTSELGNVYNLAGFAQTRAEMERIDKEIVHSFRNEYWPPQQSGLCPYCAVKSCEFNPNGRS
jgi:hypothetical protein